MISLYGSDLTDIREGLFIANSCRMILKEFSIKSPSLTSVKFEPYNEIMLYKKQKQKNKDIYLDCIIDFLNKSVSK